CETLWRRPPPRAAASPLPTLALRSSLLSRHSPRSPLFPYTTLFRSPSGSAGNSNGLSKRPPQASPQEIAATAENFERENSDSPRSEERTSELQSPDHLVCRLLLEKKKTEQEETSTSTVAG